MARPSKLTPQVQKRIIEAITMGATRELAAKYAGVAQSTLYEWLKRPQFTAAIEEAEGKASVLWLAKIEKAATDGQWQAAAWKLERRHPDDYGRRERQDVHHSGETKTVVIFANDWKQPLPAARVVESEPAS